MDAQAMTLVRLTEPDLILHIVRNGAALAVGVLLGALHFLTLRWNIRLLVVDQSLPLALALQFARLGLVAGVLAVIAGLLGALPLIVAAAGILMARTALFRFGGQL
jgi:F1F0 ATPase subunit 2